MTTAPYTLTVTGTGEGKTLILGNVVKYSANLTNAFFNKNGDFLFLFRYKGDARLVLNRVRKALSTPAENPDVLHYLDAMATISRL